MPSPKPSIFTLQAPSSCATGSVRNFTLLVCAGLMSASLAAQTPINPSPVPPPTPPRYQPGAVTILAMPGTVTDLNTGQTYTRYTNCGVGPITNAVAFALRLAQPGDVVGVTGAHPRVEFVPVQNPCRQNEVSWGNGDVVRDVDIVGLDPTARIDSVFITGDYTVAGQGGIDRVTFQGLTLRNPAGTRAPLSSTNVGRHGLLRVYDCFFEPEDPNAWGGKGMKFGARLYLLSLDARSNIFLTGGQEHNFYCDSPGFDGAYSPSMILDGNQTLASTGRTGIQIVNRIYPVDNCNGNGNSYIGAPGKGTILIRNNRLHADASAGGGAVITIAGHHGRVWIENNSIRAEGGMGGCCDTGGITVWVPCNTWLTNDGFGTRRVYVQNNTIFGAGTREGVGCWGTKFVWIGNNTIQHAGDGVHFDAPGEIPNGQEFLPPSTMAGWQQAGCKVRDTIAGIFQCLTDLQIDTLY